MRKISILVLVVCILLTMLFTGCGASQEPTEKAETETKVETETKSEKTDKETQEVQPKAEPILLKWYMATAVDHVATKVSEKMCKEIEERTEGRIKVELFPASQLGNEQEGMDMVRSGAIALGTIGNQMFQPFLDDIQGWMMPYTFDTVENCTRFHVEYAWENIYDTIMLEATGARTLGFRNYGARHLTTKGIEVKSPADLKGKKIRSMEQPISISYIESLGGNPVPIAFSELYMALQTGTAVGQENPISNVIAGKFYEVQDYMIITGHSCACAVDIINEKIWQSISKEDQEVIKDVFLRGSQETNKLILEDEEKAIEQLESKGMKVLRPEDIDMAAFMANAEKVIEKNFSGPEYDGWRKYNKIAKDWVAQNSK